MAWLRVFVCVCVYVRMRKVNLARCQEIGLPSRHGLRWLILRIYVVCMPCDFVTHYAWCHCSMARAIEGEDKKVDRLFSEIETQVFPADYIGSDLFLKEPPSPPTVHDSLKSKFISCLFSARRYIYFQVRACDANVFFFLSLSPNRLCPVSFIVHVVHYYTLSLLGSLSTRRKNWLTDAAYELCSMY